MPIKWATTTWNYFLLPVLKVHHKYWGYKVVFDQYLEQRTWYFNATVGVVFGAALYFVATPLLPPAVEKSHRQIKNEMTEMMASLNVDPRKEFPGQSLNKFRREILSKVHSANDRIAIKQQAEEMEKLRQQLESQKAELLASGQLNLGVKSQGA
jgi:hypothetical protein